jgi:hypothetical protein
MIAAVAVPVKTPADSPDSTRAATRSSTVSASRNIAALATATTTPPSRTGRRPIASDQRPKTTSAANTPPA